MSLIVNESVEISEPDSMTAETQIISSEPEMVPKVVEVTSSQGPEGVPSDSTADRRASGMLAVVQDMRRVRDALPPRPVLEEVLAAHKEVSALDKEMIRHLAETAGTKRPYGVESAWFEQLQLMREDRCRRDMNFKKRPFQAVLEVDKFYRHYDDIIMQAERALVGGVVDSEGSAGQVPVGLSRYVPPVRPRTLNSLFAENSLRDDSSVGLRTSDALAGGVRAAQTLVEPPVPPPVILRKTSGPCAFGVGTLAPETTAGQVVTHQGPTQPASTAGVPAPEASISGVTSGGLESINEASSTYQLPPQLMALLEDAAEDSRKTLNLRSFPNGLLTWLPPALCDLDCLTELDLRANQLQALPPAIGQLANLTRLHVSNNKLVDLPDSLGQLKNLTELDFSGNKVEEVPVSIGRCINLVTLRAEFNSLKAIPEDLGNLTRLQTLTLHLNQLKRLPRTIGSLESLTFLDVHYNQIEHVPDGICRLTNLTHLNLSAQHFSLQEIPWALGNLDRLTYLDLSENHLKVLPDSIVNLTGLKKLRLDGNPLQVPPRDVAAKGKDAVMEYLKTRSELEASSTKNLKLKVPKKSIFGSILKSPSLGSASNLLPGSKIFSSRFSPAYRSLPGGSVLNSPERG